MGIDYYETKVSKDKYTSPPEEIKRIQDYIDMGLLDSYREFYPKGRDYSYWSYKYNCRPKNMGWRFDYWFADEAAMESGAVEDSLILTKQMGSDHCPTELKIDLKLHSKK